MKAGDVTETLELALAASGCDSAKVRHKPRLLSDNGSSYVSGDLAEWLEDQGMDHVRGAPSHPPDPGQDPSQRLRANACRATERWHQTLKNRVLLENHYLPGALEAAIGEFVDHYNNHRCHESTGNVTPADAYLGRAEAIISERRRIKEKTMKRRRLINRRHAA